MMKLRLWPPVQAAFCAAGFLGAVSSSAAAQLKTYCVEGGKYTCFGIELSTAPSTNGTTATLRLTNLEGATLAGVPAAVAWSRIIAVDILGHPDHFDGGPVISQDPTIAMAGSAKASGDTRSRWFALNIADEGGDYFGYELETPYTEHGADIIGCTMPPDQGYPYFQTCNASGDGSVSFSFDTQGSWNPSQIGIGVEFQDSYGSEVACLIGSPAYDNSDEYHCLDMSAPANHTPVAEIKSPSTANEGSSIAFDASSSTDADGDVLTYSWAFGDGATATGATPSHTYGDNGSYTVTLTVNDGKTTQSTTALVNVANVAPTTSLSVPSSSPAASSFTLSASGFSDPSSADAASGLQFAFDCGTGIFAAFSAATSTTCTAPAFGFSFLRVMVRDKDGGTSAASRTVGAINEMNIQPGSISLTTTGTVSVYLYSTSGFDATQVSAASVDLRVSQSTSPGASVATRSGAPMTAVGDYNHDGRPDRLFVFLRSALQTTGLSTSSTTMQLEGPIGATGFTAFDPTPPAITP